MSPAKIALSAKELEMVNDGGLILTKNAIIQKVCVLFGMMSDVYRTSVSAFPALAADAAFAIAPKIGKGENYRGLPWVMLDYPRCFKGQDVCAIRTFFWWGHFASITLQLTGKFQQHYTPAVQRFFASAGAHDRDNWFLGTGDDPWQHHFETDNYRPPGEWLHQTELAQLPFLKLSKKIPLTEWNQLEIFFEENYTELLCMLTGQAPRR